MWRGRKCGREFANRNQSHACGPLDLEHHFNGKPPEIRTLFDAVVAMIRQLGPVRILPEKTRIAFQVRMSFAQVTPRRHWLDGHVEGYAVGEQRHLESSKFGSPGHMTKIES